MNERMLDRADEFAEHQRNEGIQAARNRLPTGKSPKRCKSCDEVIPLERRKAMPGIVLCVECQSLNEQAERRFRR